MRGTSRQSLAAARARVDELTADVGADELREKAEEESSRIRDRGEQQLAAEREQVIAAVRADLGRLAAELAERIVGESLDDDARQRRIVDRFLDDLGSRPTEDAR